MKGEPARREREVGSAGAGDPGRAARVRTEAIHFG